MDSASPVVVLGAHGTPGPLDLAHLRTMTHTIEFVARDHSGITTIVTSTGVTDLASAIGEIEAGATYVAGPSSFDRARVRIMTVLGSAYLFANWDGSKRNNLHDLAHQLTRPVAVPSATRRRRSLLGALRRRR